MLITTPRLRVGEVAEELGVAASTAHRLLSTLAAGGFVTREAATRSYLPGPALLELGLAVLHGNTIRDRSRPVIEALRDRLDATVSIAMLDVADVLFIDAVLPDRLVQVGPRVGNRSPAHLNASGKALLAELSDSDLASIYPSEELVVVTDKSISTRTALLAEIAKVRTAGYATVFGEVEVDAGAVGVVIRDPGDRAIAALAVTALVTQLRPDIAQIVEDAKRAALDIQARIVGNSV
jgi:DNA-binding IclR family transcriptional regulator